MNRSRLGVPSAVAAMAATMLVLITACERDNPSSSQISTRALPLSSSSFSGDRLMNIAELRNHTSCGDCVEVLGYFAIGDGGGGMFCWTDYDQNTNHADDGGVYIAPSAYGNCQGGADSYDRWVRNFTGHVDVRWFGPKAAAYDPCGRSTSDGSTAAIQRAVDFAITTDNKQLTLAGCRYEVADTITVATQYVNWIDEFLPFEFRDGAISYTGTTSPAIRIQDQFTPGSGYEYKASVDFHGITLDNTGGSDNIVGLDMKVVNSHFTNLEVTGFGGDQGIGALVRGSTSNHFQECIFRNNGVNLQIEAVARTTSSGTTYDASNRNTFDSCTFNNALNASAASVYLKRHPNSSLMSPGNWNNFRSCWFGNAAGHSMLVEAGEGTTVETSYFEGVGTQKNLVRLVEDNIPGCSVLGTRIIANHFIGVETGEDIHVGPGVDKTKVIANVTPGDGSDRIGLGDYGNNTEALLNHNIPNSMRQGDTLFAELASPTVQTGNAIRMAQESPNGPQLFELIGSRAGSSTETVVPFIQVTVPNYHNSAVLIIEYSIDSGARRAYVTGRKRLTIARYYNMTTVTDSVEGEMVDEVSPVILQAHTSPETLAWGIQKTATSGADSGTQTFNIAFDVSGSTGYDWGYIRYTARLVGGTGMNGNPNRITVAAL